MVFGFSVVYFSFFSGDDSSKEDIKSSSSPTQSITTQTKKRDPQSQIFSKNSSNNNYENTLLVEFRCNNNLCSFNNNEINTKVFYHYIDEKQIKIIYTSIINPAYKIFFCELDKSFYIFLQGENYNENKDLNDASFLPILGS